MMRDFPDYPFLKVMENLGYQNFLATALRVRDKIIGHSLFQLARSRLFPARAVVAVSINR
jgi:hypothetical protein